jgi:DNA-binding transcriptional ArsR family regulator
MALADPHRRAMLDAMRDGGRPVGELAEALGLPQPMTSKHLRVLRESGLVVVRKNGQQRIYAVSQERMAELDAWLAPYRRLWNDRLDTLGRHLDEAGEHDQRTRPDEQGRPDEQRT